MRVIFDTPATKPSVTTVSMLNYGTVFAVATWTYIRCLDPTAKKVACVELKTGTIVQFEPDTVITDVYPDATVHLGPLERR